MARGDAQCLVLTFIFPIIFRGWQKCQCPPQCLRLIKNPISLYLLLRYKITVDRNQFAVAGMQNTHRQMNWNSIKLMANSVVRHPQIIIQRIVYKPTTRRAVNTHFLYNPCPIFHRKIGFIWEDYQLGCFQNRMLVCANLRHLRHRRSTNQNNQ